MEKKFYPSLSFIDSLSFIGHLETAQADIRRLLNDCILMLGKGMELLAGESTGMSQSSRFDDSESRKEIKKILA